MADTLAVIGERWTPLVLREVLMGRRRFREIQRQTGVAPNILSDRLDTLVERGVLRRVGDEPEYRPTRKAVDLQPVLLALIAWGNEHAPHPEGPPRIIVHTACGHPAEPEYRCTHCGEHLDPTETLVVPGPGATEEQRAEGPLPRSVAERAAAAGAAS